MAEIHKLILLELERNRFCFAAAIKCAELDGRQLLVAEAAEALSVVIQLARAVSQHHYHHCQAATDVYRRAAAAGDPVTAAQAAIRVQEASSLAIWAARLGCGPSSRLEEEAIGSPPDASLQAAFEPAAQLAETALSGSPPDIGDLSCFVAIADVGRQFKLEQLQKRPRLST
ncbi:hypothetical protein PLESTM_001110300 [Pleodorina starrii]|nr:hypothetical protein PLESTM_001110300 [Pleodorina starrii]